jgi:hypothetical protein
MCIHSSLKLSKKSTDTFLEVSVDFRKIVVGRVDEEDQGRMENTNKADLTLPTQQVKNPHTH